MKMKMSREKESEALLDAVSAYEKMYEFDDNNEVDKALKSAQKALELSIRLDDYVYVGNVFVFLGDFEKAKIWYEKALYRRARDKGLDSPRELETYGYLYPDIVRLSYKIVDVSRGKNPPYIRTLKRKNREEIRLVAFDLDGTLTNLTDLWRVLNERFGTASEHKTLADKYYSGKIDYRTWAYDSIALIRSHGANRKNLKKIIEDVQFTRGVPGVLYELRERDKAVTLITGSLDIIAQHLFGPDYCPELFDSVIINKLKFYDNGLMKDCDITPYGDGKYKAKGLKLQVREFGLRLEECAYVGDNSNDIEVAEIAGLSIGFNPKTKEFKEVCDVIVEEDMKNILSPIFSKGTKNE